MSAEGIEPSTNGLKGRCSAIELRARETSEGHFSMRGSERQRKTLIYREGREGRQENQIKNLRVLGGLSD